MMCHRIGRPPISTIGLGLRWVSSLRRVPNPPARMTHFMLSALCPGLALGESFWKCATLDAQARGNQSVVLRPIYALAPSFMSSWAHVAKSCSIHGTAPSRVADLNVAVTPLPGATSRSGPTKTEGQPAL